MERLRRLVLGAPAAVLSWLGRQGTRAVAALIVVGIVAPSIGALLKPFVTEAVFALLCIAFLGSALTLSPSVLGLKLFAILSGSSLVGFTVRRIAGLTAIERQKERIDGFNILVLFVFVAGVMESVAARFLATPMITIGLAALTFVVFFAVPCLTLLIFASYGRVIATSVGFMAAQRNVGLM